MATHKTSKARVALTALQVGLKHGFRSGLEELMAQQLEDAGIPYEYESVRIPFTEPSHQRHYTPDFKLPNGIFIETKGRLLTEDRQKHLWIKEQHPELDIRFVFSRSKTKINPRSTTTYADWCLKNGFQFADKKAPDAWLKETK